MLRIMKILLFILVISGLISLLFHNFPEVSSNSDKFNIFYYLLILVTIGSSVILRFKSNIPAALKQASIWVVLFISIIIIYGLHNDIVILKERFLAELIPSRATSLTNGKLAFRVSSDGHFRINTIANGVPVRFMLDTGASDVVIPPHIAKKLGFDLNRLAFTKIYNTANGQGRGAPIVIKTLQIGEFRFDNINASVNETEMDSPLLGMSFLHMISSYEVKNGILTLEK